AIGVDIWQVKSGTIFDNVLVADSVEDAKAHAAETFEQLKEGGKKMKEKHDEGNHLFVCFFALCKIILEERNRLEDEEMKRKEEEEEKKKEEGDKEEDEDEDEEDKKKEDHDEL